MNEPAVTITNERLSVQFDSSEPVRELPFECIIDRDHLGGVVGIEILSFRQQLGHTPPKTHAEEQGNYSYDEEVDAFYLHIRAATAPRQEKKVGRAMIGETGAISMLEVPLELPA